MKDTYIISLNNPTDLINTVSELGLNPILVDGVNGKKLSSEEINNNTTYACSLFCPKSVIGIAMSHIKVWNLFLESKKDSALVLEDDAVFTKNFIPEFENGIKNVPNDFDILYLGCFGCNTNINVFTVLAAKQNIVNYNFKQINEYINKPLVSMATHGYVISRKGAKKLIKLIEHKINFHLDYIIQVLVHENKINIYSLNNRIIYQTSTDETTSTNSTGNHPILINNLLFNYYIDKKVKANYLTTLSILRVGNININTISIIFFFLGIFLSSTDLRIEHIIVIYTLISIPDLYMDSSKEMIWVHFILFVFSFIIFKYNNLWSKIDYAINNL